MNGGASLLAGEVESFRARYPFRLDLFQDRAIEEIAAGRSVLVSAPTGAGKTLVAEFAIWLALARQRRIIYTTPLKALSNQKFADFASRYGEETVGLLTGDLKVNPDAPLLVMTTEILRNMLFQGPVGGLSFIVLDEFHYLGDESRGTVWEEIVVHAPRGAQLVALSATVGNVAELAGWITEAHGEIVPIVEENRPVPLDFRYYLPDGSMLAEGDSLARARQPPPRVFDPRRARDRRHRGGLSRAEPRRFFRPDVARVIEALDGRGWLPCLYFIFSRAGCEQALEAALGGETSLLSEAEHGQVREAISAWEEAYPGLTAGSTLYDLVTTGLRRGLGVHHAGVLPALKRLTEQLFERGLCKMVFATETMSLGIHMPARSVFLQELRKRGEAGFRGLTAGEVVQMAGRAGRRGIDDRGFCVIGLADVRMAPEVTRIVHGPVEPVRSRFQLRYSSAILLLRTEPTLDAVRATIERSFAQYQRRGQIAVAERELSTLARQKEEADRYRAPCGDIAHLHRCHAVESRMEAARSERAQARRAMPRRLRSRWSGRVDVAARLEALDRELAQVPCTDCAWRARPTCEAAVRTRKRVADRLDHQRSVLRTHQDSSWDQFLRVMEVLVHFGYVDGDTTRATEAGRLLGDLRHENELLAARAVHSGALSGISAAELAAVLSCLVEEGREGDPDVARDFFRHRAHLRRRFEALERLRDQVERAQRERRLLLPLHLQTAYVAAAYAWASGTDDWLGLVTDLYGGHEGDLIRALRRLIDLSRQLSDSPSTPPTLRPVVVELIPRLDRGIVLESALL